ncbi:MAG: hypothetical protein WBM53_15075, partial [Maribacter sp.]
MKGTLIILTLLMVFSCKEKTINKTLENQSNQSNGPAKVELQKINGKYRLLVNKKEFYIDGAGLEFGNVTALAKHNANSFRTWRTENGKKSAKEVLDEAHKNGLMVTMGIEVARERHGFD